MTTKPVVIVVGADKGGVGKTTVSRTLLDYFSANNIPTRAFDTESPPRAAAAWLDVADDLAAVVWLDGIAVMYTAWDTGEPNDLEGEDCVVLRDTADWNDQTCALATPFVCELATGP